MKKTIIVILTALIMTFAGCAPGGAGNDNPRRPGQSPPPPPVNPDKPSQTETLPVLTIGGAAAAVVRDALNAAVLNVSITIPVGATTASVALTDGANFAFAGKTFNFAITFASGAYDGEMVEAIKGAFIAKGASSGTAAATPDKPEEPPAPLPATLKIDGVAISIPVPAEGVDTKARYITPKLPRLNRRSRTRAPSRRRIPHPG